MEFKIEVLPPRATLETGAVLKQLVSAHRFLAELKGKSQTIPNENILISTLTLQEAKDSSAIENIITTQDELFKAQLFEKFIENASAKEVSRYADALRQSFYMVRESKLITSDTLLTVQKILEKNDAGFRRLPGTKLINESTGDVVYTPPQDYDTIIRLIDNLVEFINDDRLSSVDPLVKMALLHYQFETIHPFYDGNGRTGRILNILYLVLKDLLSLPILYLSRFIINNKNDYYKLLQDVRDTGNWEDWILYNLKGIEETSRETILLIEEIRKLMQNYKHKIRKELPRIYSQDLLNNLFKHPYTKIDFLMEDLNISRITAARYLNLLVKKGFLEKLKLKNSNFYVNMPLFNLFKEISRKQEVDNEIITVNDNVR
ncbi:MAG: Fic family protein [Ignavibacteria bacterium]